MDEHANAFKEEAYEILAELESMLLELDESPDNIELVDRVFGVFHTIKGSGGMFGFDAISEFTHEIESILEHVREGSVPVTPELISLSLSARDKIMQLLDTESQTLDDDAAIIISGFQQLYDATIHEKDEVADDKSNEFRIPVTYRISFKPDRDIFARGFNPLLLLKELEEMGECSVIAQRENIPELEMHDPEACYLAWDIILTTEKDENEIREVFIFVEDNCELSITPVFEHVDGETGDDYKKLGEILQERGNITREELESIFSEQQKLGEKLIDAQLTEPENIEAALNEQEHVRKMIRREREKTLSSIRVDSSRLDSLVDLVGELVTLQARLTEKAASKNDPELQIIAESVQRLTEELRDNTMSIRMIPISTLYSRVRRHVHDLSQELGKQVTLTTEGAATELDKSVIDQLNESLVHIIRNALYHGIESPDVRESLHKPPTGIIHISAHHEGTSAVITITDDGAGLDPAKLKSLAVKKGLIDADTELTEKECFALIHQPGFSTIEEVSNVSGRGVGMDVVKRQIDNLRGNIHIESVINQGTTISLRIPLTLAIIDGLLVRVASEYFVFPLTVIDECVEIKNADAELFRDRSMMTYRGEAFTYISLRDILGIGGTHPDLEKIILVKVGGKRTGFSVDQVIGKHQTVIKSLSNVFGHVEGVSGATILGDGTVALILDASQLIFAQRNESIHSSEEQPEYLT